MKKATFKLAKPTYSKTSLGALNKSLAGLADSLNSYNAELYGGANTEDYGSSQQIHDAYLKAQEVMLAQQSTQKINWLHDDSYYAYISNLGPLPANQMPSKRDHLALEPGKIYLVFVNPAEVSIDYLAGLSVDDPSAPKVLFIPSTGRQAPSMLESIPVIEEWLAEQKARLEGK